MSNGLLKYAFFIEWKCAKHWKAGAAHTSLTYFRRSVFLSRCPGRQSWLQASAGLSVTMYGGTNYNDTRYCGSLSSDIQTSQRIGYLKHFDYLWIISEFFCKNKTALSTHLPPCFYLFIILNIMTTIQNISITDHCINFYWTDNPRPTLSVCKQARSDWPLSFL